MRINSSSPPSFSIRQLPRRIGESAETKEIRRLSNRVKTINRETNYIKTFGRLPPKTPNYGY